MVYNRLVKVVWGTKMLMIFIQIIYVGLDMNGVMCKSLAWGFKNAKRHIFGKVSVPEGVKFYIRRLAKGELHLLDFESYHLWWVHLYGPPLRASVCFCQFNCRFPLKEMDILWTFGLWRFVLESWRFLINMLRAHWSEDKWRNPVIKHWDDFIRHFWLFCDHREITTSFIFVNRNRNRPISVSTVTTQWFYCSSEKLWWCIRRHSSCL